MPLNERTFNPASIQKLEDPQRLVWLPPAEVVEKLQVRAGMTIADVGAGSGYFSLPLATAGGKVMAVDFQPEMLEFLRAKLTGAEAIETRLGGAEATTLDAESCDLALLAKLWHELDDYEAVLDEQRRILRTDGRIAILDWRTDVSRPPGPPIEHRIDAGEVCGQLAAKGWSDIRVDLIGPYSYLVTATRPA